MTSIRLALITTALVLGITAPHAAAQSLDFEYYKTKVEPIFLKKRPGHARCVVCHSESNNAFRLEKPANGSGFSEEQSRKNFENARNLVKPGDPNASKLLLHPLAPEAGGEPYHSGGRQFTTKDQAEWQVIAGWVKGAK